MNDLEELIKTAERLCNNLDKIAQEDVRISNEIAHHLEICSWEIQRQANDLKVLKQIYGD